MTTKEFPTAVVLSVTTGRLLTDFADVHAMLEWMAGESLYTHQLPRVSREAEPVVLTSHPSLGQASAEAEQVTPNNYREWRDKWIARYGATLAVPKLNTAQHERIEPLSELAEYFRPDEIIIIATDK